MSKRHQSSRRRAYGRRQHEVHERGERQAGRYRVELDWGGAGELVGEHHEGIDHRDGRLGYGVAG